jgi:hypothetical protein
MELTLENKIKEVKKMGDKATTVPELIEISKKAKEIYDQHQSSEQATVNYLNILWLIISKQENKIEKKNTLEEAKLVFEKHKSSEKIALEYLNILSNMAWELEEKSLKEEIVEVAGNVYEKCNPNIAIASVYLVILNSLLIKQKFKSEWEITIEKAVEVYNQFPFSERVAIDYSRVLLNLSSIQEVSEISITAEKARCVYEDFDNIDTAIAYIMILKNLSWEQESVFERLQTEEIARSIFEKYSHYHIVSNYLSILSSLLAKQEVKADWLNTVEKVKFIYKNHASKVNVPTEYINFLSILSWKLENDFERENIVNEARNVYLQYPRSLEVANSFIIILSSLAWKQEDKKIRSKTIEEAKEIYSKHKTSEKVSISYIKMLFNLAQNQIEEVELIDTAVEAKLVYEKHQKNENVISWYLEILLLLSWKQESEKRKRDTDIDIINILKFHTPLIYIFDKHIDIMMNAYNVTEDSYHLRHCINLFKHFAEQNKGRNILIKSKYSTITEGNKFILDDDVEKLLKIFSLVHAIKIELVVKKPASLAFGHYTTGKVLQLFLKQKELDQDENREKNKYLIITKSRLNNVNYMNDPSEGKVLDQLLEIDAINHKLALKPSPWFLMSLTTAIDQLTMWSQYGDQAKGVCVVLNSGDFSEVMFSSDVEWSISEKPIKNSNNKEEEVSQKRTESKDFIYRIGYLSKQDNNKILLKEEHNIHLDVKKINKLLVKLKEILIDIDKESSLYEKVDECLEEIRYLFKSADYSYESELRVLKYMPLEPDNSNIKIDDSGDFAKLYIERDNPIQIKEVIFGPKFQNPENVTPLLYLLDKNIKFRQSEISFR